MRRITHEAEGPFLLLAARRTLQAQRAAAAEGEPYFDVSKPALLKCGASAKMIFKEKPGGYDLILQLDPGPYEGYGTRIAEELLGGPVRYLGSSEAEPTLEIYTRRADG